LLKGIFAISRNIFGSSVRTLPLIPEDNIRILSRY